MMKKLLIYIFFIFINFSIAFAEEISSVSPVPPPIDTTLTDISYIMQPVIKPRSTIWQPNPTSAFFRSLCLPAGGQIYNKQYIKAMSIIALESTFGGITYYQKHLADKAKEAMEKAILENNANEEYEQHNNYINHRERSREYFWVTASIILYSAIDAYVEAHLWNFDLELGTEPEGLEISKKEMPKQINFYFKINF